jgi:AcrR family transcriptional regulator
MATGITPSGTGTTPNGTTADRTRTTPNRRERQRAATIEEIHATARALLVADGPSAVTLRAIGRAMGMTAPALYRYYASLDDLLKGLCAAFYDECTAYIRAAIETQSDPADRLMAACRAFRRWSIDRPAEFGMMFSSPLSGAPKAQTGPAFDAAMRFAQVYLELFIALFQLGRLITPPDSDLSESVKAQFEGFLASTGVPLPLGGVYLFATGWIRLYGLVALDVFGHLHFMQTDGEPLFELELSKIVRDLGLVGWA